MQIPREIAEAALNLFDGKEAEVEALIRATYVAVIEPIDIPWVPDDAFDPVAQAIAAKAANTGYNALLAFLKEQAGIVGDCPHDDGCCSDPA